jgi:hypothetical protein
MPNSSLTITTYQLTNWELYAITVSEIGKAGMAESIYDRPSAIKRHHPTPLEEQVVVKFCRDGLCDADYIQIAKGPGLCGFIFNIFRENRRVATYGVSEDSKLIVQLL